MSLDHAKRSAEEQMCQTSEEKDTATLVVGSKGSGKTTLIATLRGSTKGTKTSLTQLNKSLMIVSGRY